MALAQLHWLPAPCWREAPGRASLAPLRLRETAHRPGTDVTCCPSARASLPLPQERVTQLAAARRGYLAPRRRAADSVQCRAGQGESPFDIHRLELYTSKVKSEVLLVSAEVDGEEDEVLVFRGYSSSLIRPTATDPGEPVLPPTAKVKSIDRAKGPFNPASIEYIQQGMTWEAFEAILNESSI